MIHSKSLVVIGYQRNFRPCQHMCLLPASASQQPGSTQHTAHTAPHTAHTAHTAQQPRTSSPWSRRQRDIRGQAPSTGVLGCMASHTLFARWRARLIRGWYFNRCRGREEAGRQRPASSCGSAPHRRWASLWTGAPSVTSARPVCD